MSLGKNKETRYSGERKRRKRRSDKGGTKKE
jgi:hypothetical protein